MIIKTKEGYKALNIIERIAAHTGNKVRLNKRISVDHGMGHIEHKDYYAVKTSI